jgi:3-oxoadipate enol-lactonase
LTFAVVDGETAARKDGSFTMPSIKRDGVKIHFEDLGSGPPIVMGHSILCSGEMWVNQVPKLAERYRVINIDQRGHGKSVPATGPYELRDMVEDAFAIMDHLEIERAVWAGLSMGGMVAMHAAVDAPDRVSALVLLDTHAGAETAYKKLKYRALSTGAKAFGVRPFFPAVLPLLFGRTTLVENQILVDEWKRRFDEIHVPSLARAVAALTRRPSIVDRLAKVQAPALVIVGEEDASLPVPTSQEIAEAMQNASLVVIPGAGHLSALEKPEEVTEAMLEFLGEVTSER